MSRFDVKLSQLNEQADKYKSIIADLSKTTWDLRIERMKISALHGYGIWQINEKTNKAIRSADKCMRHMRRERDALTKIASRIGMYELNAKKTFSGDLWAAATEATGWLPPRGSVRMTHEDFKKLMNEYKLYSQMSPEYKKIYDSIEAMYNTNADYDLSREAYDEIKNAYLAMRKKIAESGGFLYSKVKKADYEDDTSLLTGKGNTFGSTGKLTEINYSYGIPDDQITDTTITILTSAGKLEINQGDLNLSKLKMLEGNLKEGNLEAIKTDKTLSDLINLSASDSLNFTITGVVINEVTRKRMAGDLWGYVENKYTIGEAYAKAGVSGSLSTKGADMSADFKVGLSAVKVETSLGYISNGERVSIDGGVNAGLEFGDSIKLSTAALEGKASFGLFSLGVTIDDGYDYYTWL